MPFGVSVGVGKVAAALMPCRDEAAPDIVRWRYARPIGLGTSNSLELARKALGNNGIWDFFRSVVTGDMELLGKPFPDIYLRSSANLGIPASECLVIEDTLTGIQAAKAAGMRAIAIHDEDSVDFHPQIKALADAFVEDFTRLKELLGI